MTRHLAALIAAVMLAGNLAAPALAAAFWSTTLSEEQLVVIITTIAPISANFFILNKFYVRFRFVTANIRLIAEFFFKKIDFFLATSKNNVSLQHQNNIKIISLWKQKNLNSRVSR